MAANQVNAVQRLAEKMAKTIDRQQQRISRLKHKIEAGTEILFQSLPGNDNADGSDHNLSCSSRQVIAIFSGHLSLLAFQFCYFYS